MTALLVKFYKDHRVQIAYGILLVVLLSPWIDTAFPALHLREKFISAMPLLLLFLLNDWRSEIFENQKAIGEKVSEIKDKVDRSEGDIKTIRSQLKNPQPETFPRFPQIEPVLLADLESLLISGRAINVKVIGVSAKYSWPFFKRFIDTVLERGNTTGVKMGFSFVVVRPNHLTSWGLIDWSLNCRTQIDTFRSYIESHRKTLADNKIELSMCEYDNLPHWHGVQVNGSILYLGRTGWTEDGDNRKYDLKVGEVEYRRFEPDDCYGGKERIERYTQWFARYVARAIENDWNVTNSDSFIPEDTIVLFPPDSENSKAS